MAFYCVIRPFFILTVVGAKKKVVLRRFGEEYFEAMFPQALSNDFEQSKKNFGRVYTPDWIVREILDLAGYSGNVIVGKHVIDNSCGSGAFLAEIVDRYCQEYAGDNLKGELEEYVHGIEIDREECCKCIRLLDEVAERYGVVGVRWDVLCADALIVDKFDGKMDFVLGNPPYIRVHHLGQSFHRVKRYELTQEGMTDLYIAFFEIGLAMTSENGVLGYITPSSFFNSLAGSLLRRRLVEDNLLEKVVDLGHYQAFEASTYTAISVLRKSRTNGKTQYFTYDGALHVVDELESEEFYFNNNFYFASGEDLKELKAILSSRFAYKHFEVKNGFATLLDSFFIGDSLNFKHTIRVLKASTGKWSRALFPYDGDKLIPFEVLVQDKDLEEYYQKNSDLLKKRSFSKPSDWYGFGRSQGVRDVPKKKYAINTMIRNKKDLKVAYSPKGTGVYGGLYILTDVELKTLKKLLYSKDFIKYVALLKKYKSGGYYSFSSKDLETYLEYALVKKS